MPTHGWSQVQQPAFTVTASHPLVWCDRAGATVRCLTVVESAILMGFPPEWRLPLGSRLGLRAVGNAVPPSLAAVVMLCATRVAGMTGPGTPAPHVSKVSIPCACTPEAAVTTTHVHSNQHYVDDLNRMRRKLRRLARRVESLEGGAHSLDT